MLLGQSCCDSCSKNLGDVFSKYGNRFITLSRGKAQRVLLSFDRRTQFFCCHGMGSGRGMRKWESENKRILFVQFDQSLP